MKFKVGKKYVDREGNVLVTLTTSAAGRAPVVAMNINTREVDYYTAEGGFRGDGTESAFDLIAEYQEDSPLRDEEACDSRRIDKLFSQTYHHYERNLREQAVSVDKEEAVIQIVSPASYKILTEISIDDAYLIRRVVNDLEEGVI